MKSDRKLLRPKCLDLFRKIVKARAGYRCEVGGISHLPCGGFNLMEAAHLVSRGVYSRGIDTDPRNGRCLCGNHHAYFHRHPKEWVLICCMLWREDWNYVNQAKWKGVGTEKVDWQERYLELRTTLKGISC